MAATIGVAEGEVGAPAPPGLHPPRAEKKIRRNLQGKFVIAPHQHTKCTPGRARVNF